MDLKQREDEKDKSLEGDGRALVGNGEGKHFLLDGKQVLEDALELSAICVLLDLLFKVVEGGGGLYFDGFAHVLGQEAHDLSYLLGLRLRRYKMHSELLFNNI